MFYIFIHVCSFLYMFIHFFTFLYILDELGSASLGGLYDEQSRPGAMCKNSFKPELFPERFDKNVSFDRLCGFVLGPCLASIKLH